MYKRAYMQALFRVRGTLEKCLLPLSSRVGAGFCSVISSTFIGGNLANGAWPWHISRRVIPKLQMSAEESYLRATAVAWC